MKLTNMKRRLLAVLGVVILCFSLTACSHTSSVQADVTDSTEQDSGSFKELKTVKFEKNDYLFEKTVGTYTMYLDTVTNTTFVDFYSTYSSCLVPLVDANNNPKQYNERDTNSLVLIEDSDFLVFEDSDTGVHYVVTKNCDNYMIRR